MPEKNENVALGQFLWTELRPLFDDVLKLNAGDDHAKRAQIWAGYFAAATGSMCKDLGPGDTKVILQAVSEACTEAVRTNLKVVKP